MTEKNMIAGRTGDWEVVIGLEVHAQVISQAKLFSGAGTSFGVEPNEQVSLVDAAMPGMLPVINKVAIEQAVRTGLGIKAQINRFSVFDRKNYFYPDLPQGYQITQFGDPIVGAGEIIIDMEDGESRIVGITRIHLEQDAGKSIHDMDPSSTYVDLNRSGITLMEIVSDPDLRSADEAAAYLTKLRAILRYLGTCDGNMEQGSMRCDANVSVRKLGDELGTRCEIKNVNSIRFAAQAIEYEARRQIEVIEGGGTILQQTRLFDANKGVTRSMRSKEEAHDYRYFPDPDLLPVNLSKEFVEEIRRTLPELPDDKKRRLVDKLGLSGYDADVLVAERATAEYFEAAAEGQDAKTVANWVTSDLFGYLNKEDLDIADSPVAAKQLGALVGLISDGTISGRIARDVFTEMCATSKDPAVVVEEKGLKQVSDSGELEGIVDEAIAKGPAQVEQYKSGNEKIIGWFVGQVMQATKGQANPQMVNEILRKKLSD
ncbi:Asp-tRNA(Asn)/Glu-tRNA(Gln) amidotransferase subunit GatB [bacterium]|nr:Asp-tRNA(Asn)/Glu-tRNA(Gln) amidotransferase subunit GatB [bacterium]